ncbi:MAG: phosphoenolpyruvate--protein phosphotransferase [Pseudomonadota bacterium]
MQQTTFHPDAASNQAPTVLLTGQSGNGGIALGQGVLADRVTALSAVPDRRISDVRSESERLRQAIRRAVAELQAHQATTSLSGIEQALSEAMILMLQDDDLQTQTFDRIRQGLWAPAALRDTIEAQAQAFDQMPDQYLRERVTDVRELGQRILKHLQPESTRPVTYPEQTILIGADLSALQLAEVPRERLVGIISASGTATSHVAILARALGVPAVMGVAGIAGLQGRTLIIDGHQGRVSVEPTPAMQAEYQQAVARTRAWHATLDTVREQPAQTADGVPITLHLNIDLDTAQQDAQHTAAMGVGLYRTEWPFMVRDRFPSEEEQLNCYQQVLAAFAPRPVTMRTLDIGGDKPLPYFPLQEQNPFLGWRGVRISLQHPDIFNTQIRAMLRANVGQENLRILLPMVTQVSEVIELTQRLRQTCAELRAAGYAATCPLVGVMIEVPAAMYQIDQMAQQVDFFSIGTNDLAQYLLAVDRNNPQVAALYDDLHPAILRALHHIVTAVHNQHKPIGLCGEMAGDPLAIPLLVGLGVDSLSMSADSLLPVKYILRHTHQAKAQELLQQAMAQPDARQVRQLMQQTLQPYYAPENRDRSQSRP